MVLRFLLLGMLNLAPMTGYTLKKHFDATVNHFWHADRAQIYRTLAALVSDGLASVRVIPQDNYPDRREHYITDAGRAALLEWLRSSLDDGDVREPFLARLFFAGHLEPDEVSAILAERRVRAEAMRAGLAADQERYESESGGRSPDLPTRLRLATLSNGLHHANAELAWLDETERSIRS